MRRPTSKYKREYGEAPSDPLDDNFVNGFTKKEYLRLSPEVNAFDVCVANIYCQISVSVVDVAVGFAYFTQHLLEEERWLIVFTFDVSPRPTATIPTSASRTSAD